MQTANTPGGQAFEDSAAPLGPTLVHEYLSRSAARFPDKAAIVDGKERLTYRSLDAASTRLALALMHGGVRRHDRVVVFLDNSIECVIALYAVLKAGGAFVVVNGTMKSKKLAYVLRDSGARCLITHVDKGRVAYQATGAAEDLGQVYWVGDPAQIPRPPHSRSLTWDEAIGARAGGPALPETLPRVIDQDLCALIYTSGSTGEPKGVMSSHRNMLAAARGIIRYLGNTSSDVIVNVLPLSFDYGLYQVIMNVIFGGTVVFESFMYPVKVLQCIEREQVTGFPLVPTVAALLLRMRDLGKSDLSSLRYMTSTGAALPVEHIRRLRSILPEVKLFSMFGLTECKRVCYLPPEDLDKRPGSVGKAMPGCEVLILDPEGREVPAGEVGELVVRGTNVMRGYWNAPELTARVFRPGRMPGETWLYSGDYFRADEEGFLYFLGRRDEMIKCKGERVSPLEVEHVLCELDGVAEAAVVGVPDEIAGQAIKAFIVRRGAGSLSENEVLRHCSARLETFMVPRHVEFLGQLPRSPHGKIDKGALRDPSTGRPSPAPPPPRGPVAAGPCLAQRGSATGPQINSGALRGQPPKIVVVASARKRYPPAIT